MTTSTITRVATLPFDDAVSMAKGILPHISADGVTPVITTARFDSEGVIANDRYSAIRYTNGSYEGTSESMLVPRAAIDWVSKLKSKDLRWQGATETYKLVFARIDGDLPGVRIEILFDNEEELVRTFDQTAEVESYPPVERLFPEHFEDEVENVGLTLDGKMLKKLAPFFAHDVITFHRTKGIGSTSGKLGVLHATVGNAYGSFEILMQPNLLRKA